jgi:hypothetical protein
MMGDMGMMGIKKESNKKDKYEETDRERDIHAGGPGLHG